MIKIKDKANASVDAQSFPKLAVTPMSGTIGGEISGIDIRKVTPALHREIEAALLKYHLLVFRDQDLNAEQIEVFAGMFAKVQEHVFRHADGKTLGSVHLVTNLNADNKPSVNPYLNANYFWHSDKAYLARPSWITMLHGLEIPPVGGDTQFANMNRAYETLPDEMKRKIENLRVINSFEYMLQTTGSHRMSEDDSKLVPPIEHPLVRIHPETGQKSLFVTMYTREIVGMPEAEGRALLDELLNHATQPESIFTLKWRQNDLVFWDNRSLNHRAVANYDMNKYRRVLQRVVIQSRD